MTRRSSALKTAALLVALLFGFALRGRAQSTEGYVDIMMLGEFNDYMLAFAITYPDYETLYYYIAVQISGLTEGLSAAAGGR